MKISKLLIVPVVLGSILYGLGMASIASADNIPASPQNAELALPPTCEYADGVVECEVSRIHGIKRIAAYIDTGVGQVEVFDQTYAGCPTTVEFALDPIVLDYDTTIHIESCDPPLPRPGVGQRDPGSFKTPSAQGRPIWVTDLTDRY